MRALGVMVCIVLVVSCATSRGTSPSEHAPATPVYSVSAQGLLHEYWSHSRWADAKYRGTLLEVSGLVEKAWEPEPGRMAVDLQVGERSYFVRCWLTPEAVAAAKQLEHDQLIVVRGVGSGPVKDVPLLDSCSVAWTGRRPSEPKPSDERAARVAALSTAKCLGEEMEQAFAQLMRRNPAAADGLRAITANVTRYRDQAATGLAQLGARPLPCDHPFLRTVQRCLASGILASPERIIERDRIFVGEKPTESELRRQLGECAADQVTNVFDRLRSMPAPTLLDAVAEEFLSRRRPGRTDAGVVDSPR